MMASVVGTISLPNISNDLEQTISGEIKNGDSNDLKNWIYYYWILLLLMEYYLLFEYHWI